MLSDVPNSAEGIIMPKRQTDQIAKYIGAVVTIYTVSGGGSGGGFTGVLFKVTSSFVRLITCAGPATCCPPGNSASLYGGSRRAVGNYGSCRNRPVSDTGSIIDIPLDKIAAFVF